MRTPTARSARPRRGSTSATARSRSASRSAPFSASARSTTRSRRSAAAACAGSIRPVRAALRLGAYQLGFVDGVPRYAAVNESVELVRRAGLERAVPFTNAVLRRLADGIAPLLDALPDDDARRGCAQALVSGLGRRDLVARPRRRGRRRAHARAERAAPSASSGSCAARSTARPTRTFRARGTSIGSTSGARRGADLAAEPRLAARRARRRGARGRANARPLRRARAARRRCSPATSSRSRSTRRERASSRRPSRRLGATNVRVVVADGRALPAELDRLRPRARRRSVLGARRPQPRGPTCAGAPSRFPELQLELLRAAAERVRPGGTIVYSVCTINADESRGRRRRVRARGRPDASATSGRSSGTRGGPSSCRRSRTSTARPGFFIARLIAALRIRRASSTLLRPAIRARSSHAHARLWATPQPRARSRSRPQLREGVEPA